VTPSQRDVAFQQLITLGPDAEPGYAYRGLAYAALGSLQGARSSCEMMSDNDYTELCLAIIYDRLGRHADAEAMFAKLWARSGDAACSTVRLPPGPEGPASFHRHWSSWVLNLVAEPGRAAARVRSGICAGHCES
jgi:hypothetical protein